VLLADFMALMCVVDRHRFNSLFSGVRSRISVFHLGYQVFRLRSRVSFSDPGFSFSDLGFLFLDLGFSFSVSVLGSRLKVTLQVDPIHTPATTTASRFWRHWRPTSQMVDTPVFVCIYVIWATEYFGRSNVW